MTSSPQEGVQGCLRVKRTIRIQETWPKLDIDLPPHWQCAEVPGADNTVVQSGIPLTPGTSRGAAVVLAKAELVALGGSLDGKGTDKGIRDGLGTEDVGLALALSMVKLADPPVEDADPPVG